MKKLLLTLLMILTFAVSYSQSTKSELYKIFRSEFYLYNTNTEMWELQTQNKDVDIDMVSYKNVINIQAKTPTLYRIDESSLENIGGGNKEYYGYRYKAIEYVNMTKCTIDIVRLYESTNNTFLFSVIYTDESVGKINLRYYTIKE